MRYAVVDSSGEITKFVYGDAEQLVLNYDPSSESIIFDPDVGATAYWSFDDQVWVIKSEKPSEHHIWDTNSKLWVDPRTISDLKEDAWERTKLRRRSIEKSTFTWNGHVFQADTEHINGAVTGAMVAKSLNQPFSINWTLADNSVITLSADDVLSVGLTLLQHVNSAYDRARQLRNQIYSTNDPAALAAITW